MWHPAVLLSSPETECYQHPGEIYVFDRIFRPALMIFQREFRFTHLFLLSSPDPPV